MKEDRTKHFSIIKESALKQAHYYCCNHKPELELDPICGCFDCLRIFQPLEIQEWVCASTPIDWRGTAICPYCGTDSVIGSSSGYPITHEFLNAMHQYWFNG